MRWMLPCCLVLAACADRTGHAQTATDTSDASDPPEDDEGDDDDSTTSGAEDEFDIDLDC